MEIQLWREILEPYQIAVDELITKFNHVITSYRNMGQYSPIEKVQGRVKTISSILEKVQKKKIDFDRFEEEIDDIALSSNTDEGLDMLSDFGRFTGYIYRRLTPHREVLASEFPTEPAFPVASDQPSTQAPTAEQTQSATEG